VLAVVAVGGAAGTLLRLAVARALPSGPSAFPWNTLLVNLVGSLILGFIVVTAFERAAPTRYFRPLIGTGFCGGLTTFSTFAVEMVLLIRAGRVGVAALYGAVSLIVGIGLARGGMLLAYAVWNTEAS
jgi:CrcB protein